MQNQTLTTQQRVAVAVWSTMVAFGLIAMNSYSMTPGPQPISDQTELPVVSSGEVQLIAFFHPQCPCSSATIRELSCVLSSSRSTFGLTAYLYRPANAPADWLNTSNCRALKQIAGVRVIPDNNATEANRFGVHTSGHLMLFDQKGILRFSGGITAGRGHEGNNPGLSKFCYALQVVADHHHNARPSSSTTATAPVFGCPLHQ